MCLTFFYLNPDPKSGSFSLILVFNRDEFLSRVTEPAAWKDGVLAGRDMAGGREGGSGCGGGGRVVMVTEFSPPPITRLLLLMLLLAVS